jgi:hypothetical protein
MERGRRFGISLASINFGLTNVSMTIRFGALCGLKSDIFQGPESAKAGSRPGNVS